MLGYVISSAHARSLVLLDSGNTPIIGFTSFNKGLANEYTIVRHVHWGIMVLASEPGLIFLDRI